jgi:hypothetical protein
MSISALLFVSVTTQAEEKLFPTKPKVSGLAFLSYENAFDHEDDDNDNDYSRFRIRRGYLTLKGDVTERLSYRFTIDAFDDEEGAEYRLKYLYGSYKLGNFGNIFTQNKIHFGLTKTPYVDYMATINHYRMDEKMSLDRMKLVSSSDLGAHFTANFGGEMDDKYKKEVSKKNVGKYGSLDIGAYNGGGYSFIDMDYFMTYQARVSLRPLPGVLPGFQLTGFGLFSKMNLEDENPMDGDEWNVLNFSTSYQHKRFNLVAEYTMGEGSRFGKMMDEEGAIEYTGYGAFGEFKVNDKWSVIARYDYYDHYLKKHDKEFSCVTGGIAYKIFKGNIVMLSYDYETLGDKEKSTVMFTTQLKY